MITITIRGLDQYVVAHYSKEHSSNLANLFEVSPDELLFEAPQTAIFHGSIDQTSWQAIVDVRAPREAALIEGKAAEYLMQTLSDFCINLEVRFFYFDGQGVYEKINPDYPRFITEENVVNIETEDEDDCDDDDCDDDGEPYLGDSFEGHEAELDALYGGKDKD